jgi:hypothetical protein
LRAPAIVRPEEAARFIVRDFAALADLGAGFAILLLAVVAFCAVCAFCAVSAFGATATLVVAPAPAACFAAAGFNEWTANIAP